MRNYAKVSGHPNIVALRAAYESESFLYSITEVCEEAPVSSQDAGQLSEHTVAVWTAQLLLGLAHCHGHGELL